jgi:RNA polymerase sigma factor (sigma-70 family)
MSHERSETEPRGINLPVGTPNGSPSGQLEIDRRTIEHVRSIGRNGLSGAQSSITELAQLRFSDRLIYADVPDEDAPLDLTPEQTRMMHQYWPMAEALARRAFSKGNNPPDELETMRGDAFMGLAQAVRKFDSNKLSEKATTGSDFIFRTVNGCILREMRDRWGTFNEVDGQGNIVRRRVTGKVKPSVLLGSASSTDAIDPHDPHGESFEGSFAAPNWEDEYNRVDSDVDMVAILEECDPREREVMIRYYWLDQTQSQIAEHLGLIQMSVSRIIRKAQEKFAPQLRAA